MQLSDAINVLIVDDEKLSREKIRSFLETNPDFKIIGECGNGVQAIESILNQKVDLVLLDIQMPDLNGFGVIEELGARPLPHVIFITAHDEFAIKAFEVNAIDYLLKPFDKERFDKALERAKVTLKNSAQLALTDKIDHLLESIREKQPFVNRFVIKSSGRIYFLKAEQIDWIESAGNYVIFHSGKDEHLYRETLKSLEQKLDPEHFIRIHRSRIVNIDRIKELQPWSHGDYLIILQDGTDLLLSRNYKENLTNLVE